MMPNFISFHSKMLGATESIVKHIDECEHAMVVDDYESFCVKCGANYMEAIEFKYERKEFLISKDILNGRYVGGITRVLRE